MSYEEYKGWRLFIYYFGWFFGVFNLAFWAVMIVIYYNKTHDKDFDDKFINNATKKVPYFYGWFMLVIFFLVALNSIAFSLGF